MCRFTFRYAVTLGPVAEGAGPVHVWVPLAVENVEYKKVGRGWGNGDTFYPYVEVAGHAWEGGLEKQFSYRQE